MEKDGKGDRDGSINILSLLCAGVEGCIHTVELIQSVKVIWVRVSFVWLQMTMSRTFLIFLTILFRK